MPEKFACGETFVPKSRYIDPDFLQLELDRLFTQVWQVACREEEIPDPGCYYEYTIGRQSVMVVRQKDGGIKAFYNTCAHRGMKIVRGSGCAPRGTCGVSSTAGATDWTAGRRSYPAVTSSPRAPASSGASQPITVGTWGGWVFITHGRRPAGSARMA